MLTTIVQSSCTLFVILWLQCSQVLYSFFGFSGTFLTFEYLFSAPQGLFILVVFPHFRVSAQRLEDSSMTLFFSGTVAASENLRSASRTLYFGCTFPASEYLRSTSRTLSRVPVQGPETVVLTSLLEDST